MQKNGQHFLITIPHADTMSDPLRDAMPDTILSETIRPSRDALPIVRPRSPTPLCFLCMMCILALFLFYFYFVN